MLKKAMFGMMMVMVMAPMAAMAGTMHLPGNEALVHVNMPGSSFPVVLKKGMSSLVDSTVRSGHQWKGVQGSVRDMGKAVAYRFQLRGAYSGKTEIVHGLMPLRNGVATIALRPGMMPAVKG